MSSGQSLRNGSSVEPGLPNTRLMPNARKRPKVASLTVSAALAALADLRDDIGRRLPIGFSWASPWLLSEGGPPLDGLPREVKPMARAPRPGNRSGHFLPQPGYQRSRALLDGCRRIQGKVLAIASCDQLHTDRLSLMQRDRHDGAGQAEHVDRGNETQIVPEQFARALRADGVLARAGRRLHRGRRKHDREILEEQLPGPDMGVARRRGAHPAQQVERVGLRLDAAPGGMKIRRRQ